MKDTEKTPSIQEIIFPIQGQLLKVEERIFKNLEEAEIPLLSAVGHYILKAGGKRIRPALALLAANAFNVESDDLYLAASVVEYIHTATLLHDDVVDNADMRRSQKAARSIWGNEASVLVGDYLFTVSFKYIASLKNHEIVDTLSEGTTLVARGEILQLVRNNKTASEEDYFKIIQYKTACLLAAGMKVGAIIAGASDEQKQAIYDCGIKLGMAFQIIDDTLDYQLENEELGKEAGIDLKERKITLPLNHLLENADDEDKSRVLEILDAKEITDEHVEIVAKLIQKYDSLRYSIQVAEKFVDEAIELLAIIPDGEAKESIKKIGKYILCRQK